METAAENKNQAEEAALESGESEEFEEAESDKVENDSSKDTGDEKPVDKQDTLLFKFALKFGRTIGVITKGSEGVVKKAGEKSLVAAKKVGEGFRTLNAKQAEKSTEEDSSEKADEDSTKKDADSSAKAEASSKSKKKSSTKSRKESSTDEKVETDSEAE